MASQGFSFPPPPPPPPTSTNTSYSQNSTVYSNGRGRGNLAVGTRGNWRGGGFHNRGRGHFNNQGGRPQDYRQHPARNGYGGPNRGAYGGTLGAAQYGTFPQAHAVGSVPSPALSFNPQQQNYRGSNKRPHSTAFPRPPSTIPRPQAAPAVPSFGQPLPVAPSAQAIASQIQHKPKHPRKHNQLGLTPAQEEHESSSASNSDVDEESKLAGGDSNTSLQFSYKGRTSTLQTASDVAAWIAERKKRYPTQERAEARKKEAIERKQKFEKTKKARYDTMKAQRVERQQSAKREASDQAPSGEKRASQAVRSTDARRPSASQNESHNASTKARLKAEKLRRKAIRAEEAARKAEAVLTVADLASQDGQTGEGQSTSTKDKAKALLDLGTAEDISLSDVPSSPTSSDNEDEDEDETSSSGSHCDSDLSDDSSGSESYASSSSTLPEQLSTKLTQPTRVNPPPNFVVQSKKPCKRFIATGRCPRGDKCRYSHDPELRNEKQNSKTPGKGYNKEGRASGIKHKGREGLYQILMKKQEEEERRHVLRSILWLGEKGLLGNSENTIAQDKSTEKVDRDSHGDSPVGDVVE